MGDQWYMDTLLIAFRFALFRDSLTIHCVPNNKTSRNYAWADGFRLAHNNWVCIGGCRGHSGYIWFSGLIGRSCLCSQCNLSFKSIKNDEERKWGRECSSDFTHTWGQVSWIKYEHWLFFLLLPLISVWELLSASNCDCFVHWNTCFICALVIY